MATGLRRRRGLREHTGRTEKGHTRDVKIKRIGQVTVYKRGHTYCLYYRENGRTVRRPIEGNLATAEATAHTTSAALVEQRPTPSMKPGPSRAKGFDRPNLLSGFRDPMRRGSRPFNCYR